MTARLRRAVALAAVAVLFASLLATTEGLRPPGAAALLDLGHQRGVPYALVRPLWTDMTPGPSGSLLPVATDGRERARDALRIIRREQRGGVLRGLLGPRPARVLALGDLQDRGRTVGAIALLGIAEANDEWLVGRSYISRGSMTTLYETRSEKTLPPRTEEKEVTELAAA